MRNFTGLNEIDSVAFDVHGPWQLFRSASWPSCFARQSRAALDPLVEQLLHAPASAGIARCCRRVEDERAVVRVAVAVDVAGDIGVNGVPERN